MPFARRLHQRLDHFPAVFSQQQWQKAASHRFPKSKMYFSNCFAEALRKHCGRSAEAEIPFCQQPPSSERNFSLDSIKCFLKILKLLLNSIVFLIIFDDFYPISKISDIKNFMCCGSLRKLCGSFLRKRKSETLKKYMCCGSLRKVAEGFLRKQKFYTPKNSCVAEACGSLRKVICGSKIIKLSVSITFL